MRARQAPVAGALVALLSLAAAVLVVAPAAAEDPAVLGITKDVSSSTASPGETVDFIVDVSCTYSGAVANAGCTNASMVDEIPAGLTPINVSVNNYSDVTTSIDGQTVSVDFVSPFDDPAGGFGMIQGTTAEIIITVRVDDLPYDANGIPLTNEATFTATNPSTDPVSDTATVTPEVPLVLDTAVDKQFSPDSEMALPGAGTTASITASNASDEGVTELVITDPVDPEASPSVFDWLALSDVTVTAFPPAADQVQVDVFVDGAWVTGTPASLAQLPPGVDLDAVRGVRLTFTSSTDQLIEPGAEAGVEVDFVQRDLGAVEDPIVVGNTVSSEVSRDDETASATGGADYTITGNIPAIDASKTVTPEFAPHGDVFQADLTGTNAWSGSLDSLTLQEPAAPGVFDDAMSFEGFASPPQWPENASSATVTYETDLPAPNDVITYPFSNGEIPALPPDLESVTRVTLEFEGTIVPGASATVSMLLGTDADDPALLTQHDNTVLVEGDAGGVIGDETADGSFTTFLAVIMADQSKTLTPSTILGSAGQWVVATLPGGTAGYPESLPLPDEYSSVPSDTIVVQDPSAVSVDDDTPVGSDFWGVFDPTEIADVAVLADSTLTVNYWDGDSWETLAGPIAGPTTWSYDIEGSAPPSPDQIGGLQFVFESDEGFVPGTVVQPNIVFELSETLTGDEPLVFENCATTQADAPSADPAISEPGCDTIEIIPIDPDGGDGAGGTGEYVSKGIDDTTVPARTGDLIDATLWWSTGGASDVDSLTLTDVPAPSEAAIADSFYEAFNLVEIAPITTSTDPLIEWDAVASVELYREGQGWVRAAGDPCPGACDGQFPGYTLSAQEQSDTIAFRLVFVEGSARATTTDPTAPPVGSGVARSIDDERPVDVTFQIRDERRSDGSPVTGHDFYNEDDEALIRNDVRADMVVDDVTYVDDGSDVITILDVPLNTSIDKTWDGGPVGVPIVGTQEPGDYPSTRVTLTATNLTQARVDTMTVTDPSGPSVSPYEYFSLIDVVSMQVPAGTTSWTATLELDGGGQTIVTSLADPTDPSPLTSLSAGALADVVGMTVEYEGRIDPDAQAVIVLDLQLRTDLRSSGEPLDPPPADAPIPVLNGADVVVDDAGRDPSVDPATDDDLAEVDLERLDLQYEVAKEFGPLPAGTEWTVDGFSQHEPDQSEFAMRLSATPNGSARTGRIVVIDEDASFWNAYQFVRFDESFTYTDPIDQVQIDVLTGGTFVEDAGDVSLVGANWVDGVPGPTPVLPAGVTADEVQGLRISYTRQDGGQWENATNPTQYIPIVIQRRDALETGGPVPTDMEGNDPAPGETEAGWSTNTIDGFAVSYLDDGSGNPLFTVQALPATAEVLYEHATTEVAVEKSPEGIVPPGSTTPYVLTITNTGEWPLIDPVITDRLPVDEGVAMLRLDPAEPDPYSYALSGAAPDPANGLPMPTDPDDVGVTWSENDSVIEFTFPAGTVLEPGQTYTITVLLAPQPGVEAGAVLVNEFGIVSERPFDVCEGSFDEPTGECRADTGVEVGEAGADRSGKLVKADNPEHGVIDLLPDDGEECVPNDDGFYGPGCIPITAPGETETWRLQLLNTGTLPLTELIAIDLLPAVGDTGAVNPVGRGSQWDPILVAVDVGGFSPAGVLSIYGTTDAAPCTDDLEPVDSACPPGAWTPIEDFDDLSVVTALKFDMVFEEGDPLLPGEVAAIDIQTRTPARSGEAGPDTIAWNTVATGAVTTNGTDLLPIEGNKVGVAFLTGPLALEKAVDGDGAEYAADEFTVHVQCTVGWTELDGTEVEEIAFEGSATVVPGETTVLEDLPWGATCTVVAEDDAGQGAWVSTEDVVGDADVDPPGTVTVTNTYDLAGLVVSKAVESDAVDADGQAIVYGPFAVYARCEFLGEQVWADGYGPLRPMVGILDDGESMALDGLPAGAECTVRELVSAGAGEVEMTVTAGTGEPAVVSGTESMIELAPEGDGSNTVAVVNRFGAGDVEIEKIVEGAGADFVGSGPFELTVECTLDQPAGPLVVWSGQIQLSAPDELTATLENVAAGATCVVAETDAAGADVTTLEPAGNEPGTAEVVVGSDEVVTVTATNSFDTGDLRVSKAVAGGASGFAPDAFTVTVSCTVDQDEVFSQSYVLDESNGFTVDIVDEIPYGAVCIVTEDDAGQTSTIVVPGAATVGVDEGVTVTNVYPEAPLAITKTIDSDAMDAQGGPVDFGPFLIRVQCEFLGERVWADGYGLLRPMLIVLRGGETVVLEGLPAGTECTVAEIVDAGAVSTTVTVTEAGDTGAPEDGTSGALTLAPGLVGGSSVEFVNAFDSGDLEIVKSVSGPGAEDGLGPFTLDVECVLAQPDGALVTWSGSVQLGGSSPLSTTVTGIAAGSTCVVSESDSRGAFTVVIEPGEVVVVADDVVTVDVDNWFELTESEVAATGYDVGTALRPVLLLFGIGGLLLLLRGARRKPSSGRTR